MPTFRAAAIADDAGDQAGAQRVIPQRGAHGVLVDVLERQRQRAGGDQRRQELGLGLGLPIDHGGAAGDAVVATDVGVRGHGRVVDHHRVQGDRDLALGVADRIAGGRAGQLLEGGVALAGEGELGLPLAGGDAVGRGLDLRVGTGDVGPAERHRAHLQLGGVGRGPLLARLGRAEHRLLVRLVRGEPGVRIAAVHLVEGRLLVLGVAGGHLREHRPELELRRGAHRPDDVVGVLHVGDRHHDVAALVGDLRLRDALGVHAVADDVEGGVDLLLGGGAAIGIVRLEGDAGPATQVEPEPGLDVEGRDRAPHAGDHHQDGNQRHDQPTLSWHCLALLRPSSPRRSPQSSE